MQLKPLHGLYLMNTIYGLAGSFIGIFIPIYLLSRNLNAANVFWFYLVYALGCFVFFFLANEIAKWLGLRKTVLLGFPFLFLYFFLLYTLDQYGTPLYIIATINAVQTALYWFPLHIWLTRAFSNEHMGNELGKLFAYSKMIGIFAPFAAGFIVFYLGFKVLFIFTGVIYLISAIPLFFLPEVLFYETANMRNFITLFKEYRTYALADILENIREDAGIIWPVFIFLSFRNILSIGYIGTIGAIGGTLFTLLVGKYADKIDKKKMMATGAVILTLIWVMRIFTTTELSAYISTLLVGFFEILILIPLNSVVYGVAKRESAATFIIFREALVTIGRVTLYIFALLALSNIRYTFVLVTLVCALLFLLSNKNLDTKVVVVVVHTHP